MEPTRPVLAYESRTVQTEVVCESLPDGVFISIPVPRDLFGWQTLRRCAVYSALAVAGGAVLLPQWWVNSGPSHFWGIGIGVFLATAVIELLRVLLRRSRPAILEVRGDLLSISSGPFEEAWQRGAMRDVRTCLSRVSPSGVCLIHVVIELHDGRLIEIPLRTRQPGLAAWLEQELRRALRMSQKPPPALGAFMLL